jgi:hypothetical protein
MRCAHCAFDCGPVGEDMSLETYQHVLAFAQHRGGQIALGGGEPTLHPHFELFLQQAIDTAPTALVQVTTNGKAKDPVWHLLERSMRGEVHARLTLDKYHEPIDTEIIAEFRKLAATKRWRTPHIWPPEDLQPEDIVKLAHVGRAKNLTDCTYGDHCICNGPFITPRGMIRQCGCVDHTPGNCHIRDWRTLASRASILDWPCARRVKLL